LYLSFSDLSFGFCFCFKSSKKNIDESITGFGGVVWSDGLSYLLPDPLGGGDSYTFYCFFSALSKSP
jgi:hypothetical protein